MENLILFPIEGGVYHPFQMEHLEEEELTREIREYLLYAGYVQIDDESIAEDYELEAQEHAKLNRLGGWKESADEQEGEQNSSGAQKNEDEEQIGGNTKNDNDAEAVTDAKENDGAENDDANFIMQLFHKIELKLGIEDWSMVAKGFWVGVIGYFVIWICKQICKLMICAVHKIQAKKREKEKALRNMNRYKNMR